MCSSDLDEGKSYTISKNKNLSDLDDKRIQTLYYDSLTNHLWIGTFSNGLYVYDSEKKELNNINPGHHPHPIRNITNINTNRVWVAIDGGGIKEYNRFTCEYEKEYTQDSNDQNHISVNSIYHLLNNGNSVWICTYTGGVLVYNKSKLINNIFSHIQNNIHSLRNSHVNCLLEDKKGRIWFGTNKGISRFNPQNNEWKHFLQNSSTGNSVILSLYQDNDDNVWAGGYACDVIYIDNNDKIHYIDEFVSKNERQKYIYALNGDSKGNIWMGGIINELMRFSPVTKKIEKVQLKGINQIVNYNQDTLLLATSKGLMFLDINTNHYSSPITKDSLNPIKAITQSITFMPKDPQNIWIATEGQGIICYNLKTQELQQFTKSNGLSSNNICGIQYDNHGRIWASSENGINCIYPNLKRIDVFYEQDGLPTNTLNFRSHMKTNNGNIFWGTSAGAFELAPSEFIQKSKQVYNLRFIEFALFNKIGRAHV